MDINEISAQSKDENETIKEDLNNLEQTNTEKYYYKESTGKYKKRKKTRSKQKNIRKDNRPPEKKTSSYKKK